MRYDSLIFPTSGIILKWKCISHQIFHFIWIVYRWSSLKIIGLWPPSGGLKNLNEKRIEIITSTKFFSEFWEPKRNYCIFGRSIFENLFFFSMTLWILIAYKLYEEPFIMNHKVKENHRVKRITWPISVTAVLGHFEVHLVKVLRNYFTVLFTYRCSFFMTTMNHYYLNRFYTPSIQKCLFYMFDSHSICHVILLMTMNYIFKFSATLMNLCCIQRNAFKHSQEKRGF